MLNEVSAIINQEIAYRNMLPRRQARIGHLLANSGTCQKVRWDFLLFWAETLIVACSESVNTVRA